MCNFVANWPAPSHVKALTTTRKHGHSKAPYDHNNLALHVGDHSEDVQANRHELITSLQLPKEPEWLIQTHSTDCVLVDKEMSRHADAAITKEPNCVLAIMTADCLPILLCNQQGTEIAAIHAGWRGLVNGVIENTLAQLKSHPNELMAWIGPSICQACYEVDDAVRRPFLVKHPFAKGGFKPSLSFSNDGAKWLANLPDLAEKILKKNDVDAVYQSSMCTFEQKEYFYSYRRASQTGRIATLIWLI